MKKLFVLLLVTVFLITVTACSSGSNTNKSATSTDNSGSSSTGTSKGNSKEPLYVVKVLTTDPNPVVKESDQTPVGKVIKDKFNIVFQFIPFSGNYRDKLNMMLASGDYPEILRVERQDIVEKYIKAGAALPLDQYVKNSKYFKDSYKKLIPYWRMASPDGKLYKWEENVPQDINNVCECNDIAIRNDVLKEQGYPKLLSASSYIDFLKKAMKAHPTTNGKKTLGVVAPFAESWGMAGILPIMYEKGDKYIAIGNAGVVFNKDTQKFEDYFTNPYVKDSFKFFNQLYRDGLLDKESFTDTMSQVQEKINSGQALAVWYTMWALPEANTTLEKAGHTNLEYVGPLPIQADSMVKEGQKKNLRLETVRPFDSVIITKNAKYPKRLFDLVDWASSEQGQLLLQSGIKGVHYNVVNGHRVLTDAFIKGYQSDPNYLAKQGIGLFPFLGNKEITAKDGQPYNLLNDTSIQDKFALTKTVLNAYKAMGWANSKDWYHKHGVPAETGLASGVVVDPSSPDGMLEQKMVQLRVQNSASLVEAKSDADFEKIWNSVMQQYKALHPEKVVNKYNQLLQQQLQEVKKYQN